MNTIISKIKNCTVPAWSIPIVFLLLCFLSFGLLITKLGFYWDDWAKTLVYHVDGLKGYWEYYAYDRPLSAWTHVLLYPFLGEVPLHWHIFTLLMRWLSAVAMWWCLGLLWPAARRPVTYATLLFIVYPVFTQQSIAVTYHQQWMQYVLYFLSLGFMILAIQKKKYFWILSSCSILLLGMQITITEYFIPLELIRPFILWFLISKSQPTLNKRIFRVIKLWLPYLLMLLIYIIWRQFFMQLTDEDPYQLSLLSDLLMQPGATIKELIKVIFVDSVKMILTTWSPVWDIGLSINPDRVTLISWLVSIVCFLSLSAYLWLFNRKNSSDEEDPNSWIKQALIIGLFAMILGVLPAWITNRSVIEDYHADRYALPSMWGIALLFICALEYLVKNRIHQSILLSLLIGLAVIFHIRTGDEYRQVWENQISFYWQLHWRAPNLEPGTAIILEEEPFPNQGLFSTSSAINFLYPQTNDIQNLSYWVYTLRPRYSSFVPDPLEINFKSSFRSLSFMGSTPASILIYYDPGRANCLWVLDQNRDQNDPALPDLTQAFLPISNLNQIKSGPVRENYPPKHILGSEPDNDWCYFYQKAELARQSEDWQTIVDLANKAREEGYEPIHPRSKTPHEWLVFIEGYAYTGQWSKVEEIINSVIDVAYGKYDAKLCSLWQQIEEKTPVTQQRDAIAAEIKSKLSCEGK